MARPRVPMAVKRNYYTGGVTSMAPREESVEADPRVGKGAKNFTRIRLGIFLTGLAVFAQLYVFQPLLPELTKDFHISPERSSLTVSAGTIGVGAGLFILAFYADYVPRKRLMSFSILAASIVTILTSFVSNFDAIVALSFIKGVFLAGVTAVALSYLTEEIAFSVLGVAIALYLSGNNIGGMSGRVVSLLIAGFTSWHVAVLAIGAACLALSLIFVKIFPPSKHFLPRREGVKSKLFLMKKFMRDPYMLVLFFVGFSAMGVFVSVYNYLGFRLEAPPFHLPHYVISFIFLMYIAGVFGSLIAGKLSDRYTPQNLLSIAVFIEIAGIFIMLSGGTVITIAGLGVFTFGFFATHTLANRLVARRATVGRSCATCLYWLFYYIGSSVIGSVSGIIFSANGWRGFAFSLAGLMCAALALCVWLARSPKMR